MDLNHLKNKTLTQSDLAGRLVTWCDNLEISHMMDL